MLWWGSNTVKDVFEQIMMAYMLTIILASSSLMRPFREWLINKTPKWRSPFGTQKQREEEPKHPVECRLCVGGYLSLALALSTLTLEYWFVIWGVSYFMATQERN